ncbi:MAG TPA: sugar transferase [Thermoanaerobaculia bacterium]|jgi:lipopolysaccharide/colanic/teichoic acid biosynthesis glycosyltransferase
MTTYDFDYERLDSFSGRRPIQPTLTSRSASRRRAKGIVFLNRNTWGAYYYDLCTRRPFGAAIKRLLDIIGSTVLITLLAPLFLLIIILIKTTSRGPIMFRQRRIGFRGNQFSMYKFRTMYSGAHLQEKELAEQSGGSFLKIKNDRRITPVGRFLRKHSLDELPQLFNVLEGTMSMVGPRPLLQSDLEKLPRRSVLPRFGMPPGCTGLWQVEGRSDCSEAERLQLDCKYFDNWSLGLDLKILFRTIAVVFTGRGAA